MATILARLTETNTVGTLAATDSREVILYRKNIRQLSTDELDALREAFIKLYEISNDSINDERGYQYLAGIHGAPLPVFCPHGNYLFAVWHRAYIYWMEKALQDQVPGVTLPYWDWTSEISIKEGIPTAYTEETWNNPRTGQQEPNPLFKAAIQFTGSEFSETSREPAQPEALSRLAEDVRKAQRENRSYTRYSTAIEQPHNALHLWVGGTMGSINYAAYDPIFWVHHCNVDRQFAQWQARYPSIIPTNEIWIEVLRPFNLTTEDIWDTRNLGYEYITSEVSPPEVRAAVASISKFTSPVAAFSLAQVEPDFERAELEFHNVKHPRKSFEMRVFFNQPDADVNTSLKNNKHYAGSLYFFGHGECLGGKGHCDPTRGPHSKFDLRPKSHLAPFTLHLDVVECLRQMGGTDNLMIKLVAVDSQGNQIEQPDTDFDAIALVTD